MTRSKNTRPFNLFLCASIFLGCVVAHALESPKIPRVGFLNATPAHIISARIDAFRQGLQELGYAEGKNIIIEYRHADGKLDRLQPLASELVHLNVDVIVTAGPGDTRAAKQATSTIPIVMAQDSDPVGNGFIASLARPAGNITGLSTLYPEISGKRLELLKEIVPRLSRVAVLGSLNRPGNVQAQAELDLAAKMARVQLQYIDVQSASDIRTAFQAASQRRNDAMVVLESPVLIAARDQVAQFALKTRLPAIYSRLENVEAGGLMSYGVSINDLFRRAAIYVDKILKGAKPADLPVEQPTKFELVINLKAAQQIGFIIPPNVLARADRVIK